MAASLQTSYQDAQHERKFIEALAALLRSHNSPVRLPAHWGKVEQVEVSVANYGAFFEDEPSAAVVTLTVTCSAHEPLTPALLAVGEARNDGHQ